MAITTRAFGTTQDGQNVTMYTLTNHSGASVSMLDLGAIVTNILVPDKSGKLADVALGFDTLAHVQKSFSKHLWKVSCGLSVCR